MRRIAAMRETTVGLEILLIRHGEVPGIDPPRFRGRQDLQLTGRGRAQARAIGDWVRGHFELDAVYSSPLSRCIDTAQAIAAPLGLAVETCAEISDTDYGRWTGLSHPQAAARDPEIYRAWKHDPGIHPPPDGETLRQVEVRAAGALNGIRRRHPAGAVAMVTHDAVIRALVLHLLQAPLTHYGVLRQDPCAVNRIEWREDGSPVVALLNSTAHLAGAA